MKLIIKFFIPLLLLASCQNREDEIFVLPQDYRGYVIVLFNQENGIEPEYKNSKRIYEIPRAGVLKTQFPPNYGYADEAQFYFESIDATNRIELTSLRRDLSENDIIACCISTGKSYKNGSNDVVQYLKFFVGSRSDIDSAAQSFKKLHVADLAN